MFFDWNINFNSLEYISISKVSESYNNPISIIAIWQTMNLHFKRIVFIYVVSFPFFFMANALKFSWYHIVILICIFLIIRYFEYFFIYLLAICLLLQNVWSGNFVHFVLRLFIFMLLTSLNSFCILDVTIYPLYDLQIFPPSFCFS